MICANKLCRNEIPKERLEARKTRQVTTCSSRCAKTLARALQEASARRIYQENKVRLERLGKIEAIIGDMSLAELARRCKAD